MKKFLVALLFSTVITTPAYATKKEKALELLQLNNANFQQIDRMYDQAMIPISCSFVLSSDEEQQVKDKFSKIMNLQTFIDNMAQFWVQNYTEQELDEILKFYKTETGKKTVALMPKYTQLFMQEHQKLMNNIAPKLKDFGDELTTKYQKRSDTEIEACVHSKLGR